jgi:hypothetical protein
LAQFRVRVVYQGNGKISGKGSNFLTSKHIENAANGPVGLEANHQVKGVPGQGFTVDYSEELVFRPEAAGEAGGEEHRIYGEQ